jgi:hypothetical protein
MAGDMGDDSLSEGSVDSHQEDEDADGEVSEESEDEVPTLDKAGKVNGRGVDRSTRNSSASPEKPGLKATVSDTEAMFNGLKVSDDAGDAAEIHFDGLREQREPHAGRTPSAPPTEPNRNNLASRKRRENEKYVKEREQNPAFVPTRGSFFLHDKRSTDNGHRLKSKSRPYGLIVDGSSRRYAIFHSIPHIFLFLFLFFFTNMIQVFQGRCQRRAVGTRSPRYRGRGSTCSKAPNTIHDA